MESLSALAAGVSAAEDATARCLRCCCIFAWQPLDAGENKQNLGQLLWCLQLMVVTPFADEDINSRHNESH